MPRATVDINDTERIHLKTVPEGYVVLRRMSYGQFLQRQEMAMRIQMQSAGRRSSEGPQMEVKNAHQAVAAFEMQVCVVEHNLTDHNDMPLDFNQSFTITLLDPRVGQEIGDHINRMNLLDDEEGVVGNSSATSSASQ